MKKSIMRITVDFAVIAALVCAGCTYDGGDGTGEADVNSSDSTGYNTPPDDSTTKPSLVLGANEAWIGMGTNCDGEVCDSGEVGYIFRSNRDFVVILKENGFWYGEVVGTWSTSGIELTITSSGYMESYTYSISGNRLMISFVDYEDGAWESHYFTKRSGINPVYR